MSYDPSQYCSFDPVTKGTFENRRLRSAFARGWQMNVPFKECLVADGSQCYSPTFQLFAMALRLH